MRPVSATIEIASGPEPIWRLLSEPRRYAEYVPITREVLAYSDETVGLGSTYREYGGLAPFLGESDWTVSEYEPMTHQRHQGDDGKVRIPLDLDVEAVAVDRSRLTITFTLEPRWYLAVPIAVVWPLLVRRRAQRAIDQTVANAKRIVEAELAGRERGSSDGLP